MRPALNAVVAKMRAGIAPTPLEVGAMLFEARCEQVEARRITVAYAEALATDETEDIIVALRSFRLGGDA